MFSRQGKAINHIFSTYFANPIKRPEPVEKSQDDQLNTSQIKPQNMSSSFKAISREQYDFTQRDRTKSPRVTFYNPKWQMTRPRSAQGPKIKQSPTKSRVKKIFLPKCVSKELVCMYPSRIDDTNLPGPFIEKLKRTMSNLRDYSEKTEEKKKDFQEELAKTKESWVLFDNQLDRKDFVTDKDPPNAERFNFSPPESLNYSKNKKVSSFLMSKGTSRKELFEPGVTLGPYDKDEEKLMPRLNNSFVEFGKMPDRKELVLDHLLKNPVAPDLDKLDKAFYQQSGVRGPVKIPVMATVTSREG
jgi:hypothetical protein